MTQDTVRHRPRGLTITAGLLILTALGTGAFWVLFWAGAEAQANSFLARQSDAWYAWERSFPAADAWMALTALLGAWGLLRMRPRGLLFCQLAGGALVFLGLIDVLFFLQNGLYAHRHVDVTIEMAIHAWVLGLGAFVSVYVWRQRRWLLG